MESIINAMHASAPNGYKCADCTIDKIPCPRCYEIWWIHNHPNVEFVVLPEYKNAITR